MATHITLGVGAKLVIARKFSVTRFWDDIYNNNVTLFFVSGHNFSNNSDGILYHIAIFIKLLFLKI